MRVEGSSIGGGVVEAVSHYSVHSGLKGAAAHRRERQRCGAMSFVTRLIHPPPIVPLYSLRSQRG